MFVVIKLASKSFKNYFSGNSPRSPPSPTSSQFGKCLIEIVRSSLTYKLITDVIFFSSATRMGRLLSEFSFLQVDFGLEHIMMLGLLTVKLALKGGY